MAAERERLDKEIEGVDSDIAKMDAKLTNPNFMSRAKPEAIEETQERKAELLVQHEKLKAALKRDRQRLRPARRCCRHPKAQLTIVIPCAVQCATLRCRHGTSHDWIKIPEQHSGTAYRIASGMTAPGTGRHPKAH